MFGLWNRMDREELIELIPNCSEYVCRINLTEVERNNLKTILRLIVKTSKEELCWDYFEEYLKANDNEFIFIGSEEYEALNRALKLINKRDDDGTEGIQDE